MSFQEFERFSKTFGIISILLLSTLSFVLSDGVLLKLFYKNHDCSGQFFAFQEVKIEQETCLTFHGYAPFDVLKIMVYSTLYGQANETHYFRKYFEGAECSRPNLIEQRFFSMKHPTLDYSGSVSSERESGNGCKSIPTDNVLGGTQFEGRRTIYSSQSMDTFEISDYSQFFIYESFMNTECGYPLDLPLFIRLDTCYHGPGHREFVFNRETASFKVQFVTSGLSFFVSTNSSDILVTYYTSVEQCQSGEGMRSKDALPMDICSPVLLDPEGLNDFLEGYYHGKMDFKPKINRKVTFLGFTGTRVLGGYMFFSRVMSLHSTRFAAGFTVVTLFFTCGIWLFGIALGHLCDFEDGEEEVSKNANQTDEVEEK